MIFLILAFLKLRGAWVFALVFSCLLRFLLYLLVCCVYPYLSCLYHPLAPPLLCFPKSQSYLLQESGLHRGQYFSCSPLIIFPEMWKNIINNAIFAHTPQFSNTNNSIITSFMLCLPKYQGFFFLCLFANLKIVTIIAIGVIRRQISNIPTTILNVVSSILAPPLFPKSPLT